MSVDITEHDDFTVWHPDSVELLSKGDEEGKWRIGGVCSTEALDRQNESVLQRGLDFSEFTQFGYYNDNHQQHTAAVVGVPEVAEYRKGQGWWTEGFLLKGVKRAQEIYDLAKSLADTERRLGFSIEGKILERAANKIVRAIIRNVAITNSPVNTDCTWDLVSKSFATDDEVKALKVGFARVASEGGRVLVPEDLEKDEVKYLYKCPHCAKAFGSTVGLEDHMGKSHRSSPFHGDPHVIRRTAKSLNREEAIAFLQRIRPEYSETTCTRVIDFVLNHE